MIDRHAARTWLIVSAAQLAVFAAGIAFVINHEQRDVEDETNAANIELGLLVSLTKAELRAGDYQHARDILMNWGKTHADVSSLRLISSNDFVIADFRRENTSGRSLTLDSPIEYSYTGAARLTLTKDLHRVTDHRNSLAAWIGAVLTVIAAMLLTLTHLQLRYRRQSLTLRSEISQREEADRQLRESEARFRDLTEMSSDFFWESDAEHRLIHRTENPREAAEQVFALASPIGKRRWEIPYVSPDEAGWEAHRRLLDAHKPFRNFEIARPRSNGVIHHISVSGDPVFDATGLFKGYRGVGTDTTERKLAEEQLRIAATAFESQIGMMVTDTAGVILRVNQAFCTITGYTADEIVGQTPRLLKSGRHDSSFYQEMWESIGRTGGWQGEIWDRRKNGDIFPEWLTISAVRNEQGEVTHFVGTHQDISERKLAEERINELAFYDPLTGLPNRRLFLDRLRQAMASSDRSARHGSLMFIDLDNFKTLNDTLGHDTGDQLLQQVAHRLTACVREGDTVVRLGGDEFLVMLEHLSGEPQEAATQAESVGEKILGIFGQPFMLDGHGYHCTPSIGITLFAGHGETREELLKRADLAMYQAKAAGRNTLRFFDPKMQTVVTTRAALESDLRVAIYSQQFLLHYQPQVNENGRLIGVEALLRWKHPQRGLVSPVEFIPLAEETGLILPLSHWVLQSACAQLARWAESPELTDLTIAVNISARHFRLPNFVEEVLAIVDHHGARPQRLKLELTESLLVQDVEDIIGKMAALKSKGVGFSLDDFGTGYSSLSYLKRLPLDQLKIDQSFVRDILNDPNDAAIAKMVVALAESMGLSVIAEGVEIEAQREFLARQGCHAYQGYLFGRPLSLEALEEFVRQKRD